jgi:hypothetical protein
LPHACGVEERQKSFTSPFIPTAGTGFLTTAMPGRYPPKQAKASRKETTIFIKDGPNGNYPKSFKVVRKSHLAHPWVKLIFGNSERNGHERRTLASDQSRQYRFDIA